MPENNKQEPNLTKEQVNFANALSYMKTAKLILRDLEKSNKATAFFQKYSKEDITKWLSSPEQNEKQLRNASIYLYNASSHYRRLINYFAKMATFSYIVVPYKLDTDNVDIIKFKKSYKNSIDKLETMNLLHELLKVMTTIFREDIFYGYEYSTKDSYFLKKLPPDYCTISSTEDGVYNFAFDFSYFKTRKGKLESWGSEFQEKYKIYESNTSTYKWQELDSKRTMCIKLNEDIEYPIAPFVGLLPMIYDIEDYKMLTKAKEEIGNYKMLSLKIPIDGEGNYGFDYDEAVKFYNMMGSVLPENIGLTLTPLEIGEHTFEKAGTASNINTVADAETSFYNASGVPQLLFNSEKSSSVTINSSIKTDEDMVYAVLRQLERWINRKLKQESGTYKFHIKFLDVTVYSRKEFIEQLLKVGQFGMPVINAICACLNYSPSDTNAMAFLENEVLKYHYKLIPLQSSHTQSGNGEAGRGKVGDEEISDQGERSRDLDNRKTE